jgi:hypothetical protein
MGCDHRVGFHQIVDHEGGFLRTRDRIGPLGQRVRHLLRLK